MNRNDQNDHSPDTSHLYAWLSRDADGIEGIIAIATRLGVMALIAADEQRARSYAKQAQLAAQARGFPAQLVAFQRVEAPLDEVP